MIMPNRIQPIKLRTVICRSRRTKDEDDVIANLSSEERPPIDRYCCQRSVNHRPSLVVCCIDCDGLESCLQSPLTLALSHKGRGNETVPWCCPLSLGGRELVRGGIVIY